MKILINALWILFIFSEIHIIGCNSNAADNSIPLPQYPLCFVEVIPDIAFFDQVKKPAPLESVLLLPYYRSPKRNGIFLEKPTLYSPGGTVSIEKIGRTQDSEYRGMIVLSPGYMPTKIRGTFIDTDVIDGKKYQLIRIAKANNFRNAIKVIEDYCGLLKMDKFQITVSIDALDENIFNKKDISYATCCEITSPVKEAYRDRISLWPYDVGTIINVNYSEDECKLISDFLKKEKEKILSKEPKQIKN